jgi:FkbM family methyltransferase
MSTEFVNKDPRLAKALVGDRVFDGDPLRIVDVGARGGFEDHWAVYGDQAFTVGFELDAHECVRMNADLDPRRQKVYPYALHEKKGTRELTLTTSSGSSGLHAPDQDFWHRFWEIGNLRAVEKMPIATIDYDSFVAQEGLSPCDFMKLDTEGGEGNVLAGAANALPDMLGVSSEVWFIDAHADRMTYGKMDTLLRGFGFELMALSSYKYRRKALPWRMNAEENGGCGQVLWGHVVYLRDAVREFADPKKLTGWDRIRVLKLASIFDLFSLQDCAAELLIEATKRGICMAADKERYLNMTVPGGTYEEHMAALLLREFPAFMEKISALFPAYRETVVRAGKELLAGHATEALAMLVEELSFLRDAPVKTPDQEWLRGLYEEITMHRSALAAILGRRRV